MWLSKVGHERDWDWPNARGDVVVKGVGKGRPSSARAPVARHRSRSETELPSMKSMFGLNSEEKEEKWWFRGKTDLMDLEVVSSPGDVHMFEVLSPDGSFFAYACEYWMDLESSTSN